MTVYSIKNELKGLSDEQLISKATELLGEVMNFFDDINAQLSNPVGFGFVELILAAAIASDGEMDRDEYSAYEELCQNIGINARSYSDCQRLTGASDQLVAKMEDLIPNLRDVFDNVNRMDLFEQFAKAVACLMMNDGSIEGNELAILQLFMDDASSSSSDNGSSFSSTQTKNVEIVKKYGCLTQDDSRYYLTVGMELKNPNIAHCARNVNVKIIVKDASGRILETSERTIDYIDSGATFYYGDEFYVDRGKPNNYTVQVNCDDFVEAPEYSTFSSGITCSHYNLRTDDWGDTEFTGNVHNGYNRRLYVDLYFVFYDSSDNITGGTNACVSLYGNSDDAFSEWLHTNVKRDKVRCSPTFNFMDLVD